MPADLEFTANPADKTVGGVRNPSQVSFAWQNDNKFIAADAGHKRALARRPDNILPCGDNDTVAAGVAKVVVYHFQVIQINEHHGACRFAASCLLQLFLQTFVEMGAVRQACQHIVIGLVKRLLMRQGIFDGDGGNRGKLLQYRQHVLIDGNLFAIGGKADTADNFSIHNKRRLNRRPQIVLQTVVKPQRPIGVILDSHQFAGPQDFCQKAAFAKKQCFANPMLEPPQATLGSNMLTIRFEEIDKSMFHPDNRGRLLHNNLKNFFHV